MYAANPAIASEADMSGEAMSLPQRPADERPTAFDMYKCAGRAWLAV